ncbi:MAG: hypothetical protein LBU42_06710 [Prevotellaceae bacterium]|jgi:hypothetical protein|nr:hypothetical protein [Prevotellaceae bacterium]
MKKNFFSLLLFPLLGTGGLFAQAIVTPISVDYDRHEVKFRVAWNAATAANNRVWVFVDLCPVTGTSPGTFAKAVISGATATAGSILTVTGNTRGFYVTTNPSTVTATLSNATGKFNWCAYGSDYPPNAKNNTGGGYDMRGTPPFIINGSINWSSYTYSGGEITALNDATGYPGVLCGKNGESAGLLNCCVPGTTNCNGTCKTNGTYTTNDGACTGACNTAYVQLRDQCGSIVANEHGTYADANCKTGCGATHNPACDAFSADYTEGLYPNEATCKQTCDIRRAAYYNYVASQAGTCYCCN